jgi:hypothetical protein
VFVPTKGRAGRVSAAVLSLAPTLLVEAEEEAAYRAEYPDVRVRVHPDSGRGVSYARNQVLVHARRSGKPWCWMLDDDLYEFGVRAGDANELRVPKTAPEVLALAQRVILAEEGMAAAGIPAAWADCTGGGIRPNQCLYSCVALYLPALPGLEYRESLKLKEDLDFTLQVVARGWTAGRLDDFYQCMPHPGTYAGGLDRTYAEDGLEARMAQELVRLWPGIVRCRPGVKRETVDWEAITGGLPDLRPARRVQGAELQGDGKDKPHPEPCTLSPAPPLEVSPWNPPPLHARNRVTPGLFHRPRAGAGR